MRYRVWEIVWDTDPPEGHDFDPIEVEVTEMRSPDDIAYAVQAKTGYLPIMAEYELIDQDMQQG